jgi:MFS family permease
MTAVPVAAAIRWPLAALSLTILLASLGTSIANVALPTLAQRFDAPAAQVQWVVLAYLIATTALIVGAGRLGDLFGRRRMLLAGLLIFAAGSAICALAPDLWLLVAARAVQGSGAALMLALGLALVGDSLPKERIGRAMGLLGAMSAVGTALGPSLGGALIAGFGWPALFAAQAPLALLAALLVWRSLPVERRTVQAARLDIAGTLLLTATLAAYALAMTLDHGPMNIALIAGAVVGLLTFGWVEARVPSPLVDLHSLREPDLRAGLALNALVATVVMATLVVGPFYLSSALDLGPGPLGAVMSIGPIVAALAGLPAGRLVDRLGTRSSVSAGLALTGSGTLLLATLPSAAGVAGYATSLSLLTAGYALFQAANNTAVMRAAGVERRGVVSALLSLARNLGLVTGASAMGALYAANLDQGAEAALHLTFTGASMLVGVGLAIHLLSIWSAGPSVRPQP